MLKLGLGNVPEPIYLYVNNKELDGQSYTWYQFDINNNKTIPVHQRALTGYLIEMRLTQKEYKGKDNLKLDIVVNADELYIIRTGIETQFAKTFLLAASQIQDFSKPLTIATIPGETNVVFCRLYDGLTKAKFHRDWDKDANWAEIIAGIQAQLGQEPEQSSPPPVQDLPPHPQDWRIRQVRQILNHPVKPIQNWLLKEGVKFPRELSSAKVGELVKFMCLNWASDKFRNSIYAASSYKACVEDIVGNGAEELQTIQHWMESTLNQSAAN